MQMFMKPESRFTGIDLALSKKKKKKVLKLPFLSLIELFNSTMQIS